VQVRHGDALTAEERQLVDVADRDFDQAEHGLREFGAEFAAPTPPDQVIVWKPLQVRKAEANLRNQDWRDGVVYFGSCLSDTGPGDRAAVYETGGSGVVGFFDFSGCAARRSGQAFPYMAAGVYRPLSDDAAISLDALGSHPLLRRFFQKRVRMVGLSEEEGAALAGLAPSLPNRVAVPLPEWAEERDGEFEWEDDGIARDPGWASEHELHMKLANTSALYKRFGFKRAPAIELRSDDRTCRYDVISRSDRVVVEVKLHASKSALDQVLRYIDTLRRE